MGMFDWYKPCGEIECPVCGVVLKEWQGKDGPNALFVWREEEGAPVDQLIDEDAKISEERGEHLDYPRSLKSILTIVSIIAFWLNAEPETASGRQQASYLRPMFEGAL